MGTVGGPTQSIFGVPDEGIGIGAQGLGEVGVAFVVGPGGEQGVGGGACGLVVLVGGVGVAGGALDELVDADGLEGGVGLVVDEAEPVQCSQGAYRVPGGDGGRFRGGAGCGVVCGEVVAGRLTGQDGLGDAVGVE